MNRPWTKKEENLLRRLRAAGKSNAECAMVLPGRTATAIISRASLLRCGKDQRFTPEQDAIIRQFWGKLNCVQIGKLIGRRWTSVFQRGRRLGLGYVKNRYDAATLDKIKKLHAQGLNDKEIADHLGMQRDQVHPIRYGRLKLPANKDGIKRARQRAIKTQFRRLDIANAAQLRAMAYKKYARDHGLPEDLRFRAVQIVYALAKHGPMTLRQIVAAMNWRWKEGAKNNLFSNEKGGGGSYPANLIRRGIIFRHSGRPIYNGRQGGNTCIYDLTPLWRERITRYVQDKFSAAGREPGSNQRNDAKAPACAI